MVSRLSPLDIYKKKKVSTVAGALRVLSGVTSLSFLYSPLMRTHCLTLVTLTVKSQAGFQELLFSARMKLGSFYSKVHKSVSLFQE